jgi:AcrR family transcriptional regulator
MAESRRPRAATEAKRNRILDATEEIILTEGYAAVSSRRVAAAVDIQPSLVHYYFPTLDDLFVAVLRRPADRNVERMAEAMASPEPLRAWWRLASDPRGTAMMIELLAAANHRPTLKAAVGEIAHEVRRMQMEALDRLLDEYGLDAEEFPAPLVAAAMQGLAFAAVQDKAAGYDTSPDEAIAAMERLLDRLEADRARRLLDEGPGVS